MSRREFTAAGLSLLTVPPLLASCTSSSITTPSQTRLTARPGQPTLTPTMGRTALGLGSGRDGFLYVPESYDPAVPIPLFVALHGATGNSDNWVNYQARAEAAGMVLLAIDSRSQTWDMMIGVVGPDVEFMDQALAHTFARCRIDPQRLALAGFSDGASYALAVGRANGDLFSHLIAYSPGFLAEIGPTVGTDPVFISHGTEDPILSIEQTRQVIVPYLQNRGHIVTFLEFEGGHQVPAEVGDAAITWFLPA